MEIASWLLLDSEIVEDGDDEVCEVLVIDEDVDLTNSNSKP